MDKGGGGNNLNTTASDHHKKEMKREVEVVILSTNTFKGVVKIFSPLQTTHCSIGWMESPICLVQRGLTANNTTTGSLMGGGGMI